MNLEIENADKRIDHIRQKNNITENGQDPSSRIAKDYFYRSLMLLAPNKGEILYHFKLKLLLHLNNLSSLVFLVRHITRGHVAGT